eukprot:gene17190-22709_t
MSKFNEINTKASRVEIGLEKLKLGSVDVEKMKIVLANEEVKLKESEIANDAMLKKLEISSMEAKKEADSVSKIKEICQLDAERISGEKADAEEDLAKAQPFVEEAERAVSSIKPNDLNELKKLGKPSDIIKLIFDCVSLLKMAPLVKVEPMEVTLGVGKDKKTFIFIKDSYKIIQSGMLSDTRFLANILQFSKVEKDFINDETIELMLPYLSLEGFNPFVARNASRAAEGLCTWCKAMCDYHEASKIVKPKLEALRLAEARLQDAERELFKAEMRLKACEDVKTNLKNDYEKQLSSKRAIEENALNTRKRMEQATSLISGLSSERIRWNNDREEFSNIKQRLVGDVALACAFVAYCGPFNQEFRDLIIFKILSNDLRQRSIPFTTTLDLTEFLADIGIIGDWNLEGLPTDPLSIQNGILVTRSSRYPLLIDPQGQGLRWIASHEEPRLPPFGITTFTNIRFRDQLEYCLAEGKALVVSGIEEEIDPMLTPILEKQIITKGKSKYILVHGKQYDYNDKFFIYLITRLPNPHYTPEDQSKCTIVDFTVTLKGLEDQLLGRVIQKEQKSLEDSMKNIIEELTNNTKSLIRLDQLLLERLSENTGNLLDDEELIIVLADTKSKAIDVKDKLLYIADMRKNINEKRELYRSIATRGRNNNNVNRLPLLGPKYIEPITDTVESIYKEMTHLIPVIYLLSSGADPTDSIEMLAKRKRKDIECISMGEGQDTVALRAINSASSNGSWVLLQNGHLGLDFIDTLEDIFIRLKQIDSNCSPDFRLFITTEPHPKFSIGLLQMSIKVTNEPPKGIRASLQRSYSVIIDQDRLERIESSTWRLLLYTICFLHSIVLERRKFGALGWCIPYEFNEGDLNATLIFNPDHSINKIPENFIYKVPDYPEIDEYMSFIQRIPNTDSPEILGLHPNADLTFRYKEVLQLLDILTTVSPKQNNSTNNNTSNQSANNPLTNAVVLNKEDIVLNKCKEFLQTIPNDYNEDDYEERIIAFGGFDIPLNIFLYQEIQRLQQVINKVRNIVDIVIQAINGEVVITADILESIDAIHDARVPKAWLYSPAGDELSWLSPTLSTWYSGLLQRDSQYRLWLQSNRPHSFWLGGFFNPQGFLTAIQQEITRAHKNENWPLDLVTLHIEITEIMTVEQVKNQPKEGAYIHGLFMDGASWNSNENTIVESTPKKLFSSVPVLFVTAHYKTSKKGSTTSDYGPFGGYDCPLYKYPTRTDKYKICMLTLPSRDSRPLHWVLRGVALLCQTN